MPGIMKEIRENGGLVIHVGLLIAGLVAVFNLVAF